MKTTPILTLSLTSIQLLLLLAAAPLPAAPDPAAQPVISAALDHFATCDLAEAQAAVKDLQAGISRAGQPASDLSYHLQGIYRMTSRGSYLRDALQLKLVDADIFALTKLSPENRRKLAFVLNTVALRAGLDWRAATPEDPALRAACAAAETAREAAAAKRQMAIAAEQQQQAAAKERSESAATRTFKVFQIIDATSVLAHEYTPGGAGGSLARAMGSIAGRSSFVEPQTGAIVHLRGSLPDTLVDGTVISAAVIENGRHQYTNTLGAVATVRSFEVLECAPYRR